MKISSSIADIQGFYSPEKKTQNQSKPFVAAVWGENVGKTPEATASKRSDAEILKDMEKLALEHARTGQFQDEDPNFNKLMDEFVSSVSPDRDSIFKSKMAEIENRLQSEIYPEDMKDLEEEEKNKDMSDYLLKELSNKNGKDKDTIASNIAARGNNIADPSNKSNIVAKRQHSDYTSIDFDYGGGKITTVNYDNSGKFLSKTFKGDMYDVTGIKDNKVSCASFYDNNGEKIMGYDNGVRYDIHTSAEEARFQEMLGVYNASRDFVLGKYHPPSGSAGPQKDVNDYSSSVGTQREAYISTYERLAHI